MASTLEIGLDDDDDASNVTWASYNEWDEDAAVSILTCEWSETGLWDKTWFGSETELDARGVVWISILTGTDESMTIWSTTSTCACWWQRILSWSTRAGVWETEEDDETGKGKSKIRFEKKTISVKTFVLKGKWVSWKTTFHEIETVRVSRCKTL